MGNLNYMYIHELIPVKDFICANVEEVDAGFMLVIGLITTLVSVSSKKTQLIHTFSVFNQDQALS